jgi:hypothetical protein
VPLRAAPDAVRRGSPLLAAVGGDPPRPRLLSRALAHRTRDWHLGEDAWPPAGVAGR